MADTERADYPNTACSDCGEVGDVCIKHWGPLVPPGEVGYFDQKCINARAEDSIKQRPVRPFGVMPPAVATVESQ
jgi:hypothetical protein